MQYILQIVHGVQEMMQFFIICNKTVLQMTKYHKKQRTTIRMRCMLIDAIIISAADPNTLLLHRSTDTA